MAMLELEQALYQVLETMPPPESESVPLGDAAGRVALEQIRSPIDLPLFDNSSMDGYAVRTSDVARARSPMPVRLRLSGRIAAGETFKGKVLPGTCVRLFTGSRLPHGADAVVMQEQTRVEPGTPTEVLVLERVRRGENIRPQGEDVKQGTILAEPGERLTASRIALLGAAGIRRIHAGRQPVVGLLATGSELKEPAERLSPGQIYESNRLALAALVRQAGGFPRVFPIVADALAATRFALAKAFRTCDVVITSGGVSVGEMDFIKQAFEQVGGALEFWKVAIRPGRPFVFGRYGRKLLFGLPGNPVSALVTFLLLARPALLRWQGAVDVSFPTRSGVLARGVANPEGRRHFMRVRVDASGKVRPTGAQGSHILSSLAAANGLLDVPPGAVLAAGTSVQVVALEG